VAFWRKIDKAAETQRDRDNKIVLSRRKKKNNTTAAAPTATQP
jgi:hypothetical protein